MAEHSCVPAGNHVIVFDEYDALVRVLMWPCAAGGHRVWVPRAVAHLDPWTE